MAYRPPMKGTPIMATSTGTTSTRRWPRIAVVFVVLFVAVVGAAVYFALRPAPAPVTAPPSPSLTPTASSTSTSATVSGAPTVLADGCLGGTDPVKAIRIAHEKAPITPEGAAAFIATLARWQGQAPHDPTEFQSTGERIWAPSLPAAARRMPTPPEGTTAWISTEKARYRVIDVSGPDMTIEAFFTQTISQNGANSTVQPVGQFTVTDINSHWALKSTGPGDRAPEELITELQAEGLPYRGGC